MAAVNFDRFTDPMFLRQLGRPLLDRFLARFTPALAGRDLLLPPPTALDQEYFNLLAHLLMSPERLPVEMSEAIHEISELASPEGQQRIEQTISQAGARLEIEPRSTHGDIALQVWLADPALLARARNMQRLTRFSTFHHFGPSEAWRGALSPSFDEPSSLSAVEAECDAWFASHNRGRHNTRIELYVLPESGLPGSREYWFLVLHGDTFNRAPRVEHGKLDVLHFRPAKDDVVVYNPRRNEIRINARTVGERDLYRAAFGQCLFKDRGFFSERKTYTLAPLRRDGPDALDTRDVPGLDRVRLRDYELAMPDPFTLRTIRKATDVFAAAVFYEASPSIPAEGDLTRATFDVHFTGARLPRSVQVRPPNTLRISANSDARPIEEWLALRGFRISKAGDPGKSNFNSNTPTTNQQD